MSNLTIYNDDNDGNKLSKLFELIEELGPSKTEQLPAKEGIKVSYKEPQAQEQDSGDSNPVVWAFGLIIGIQVLLGISIFIAMNVTTNPTIMLLVLASIWIPSAIVLGEYFLKKG